MFATEKAREAGVPILGKGTDYRCPCPECSPKRRKKKDPCLHVTIGRGEVKWFCHHCEWKGATSDDDERRNPATAGGPRPGRGTARSHGLPQRAARGW